MAKKPMKKKTTKKKATAKKTTAKKLPTKKAAEIKTTSKTKTTAKKVAAKKTAGKTKTRQTNATTAPAAEPVGVGPIIVQQGPHTSEFFDDNRTSRKRRRTSGEAHEGANHEEQHRVAAMDIRAHQDESAKIRAPRRSVNQNRSR